MRTQLGFWVFLLGLVCLAGCSASPSSGGFGPNYATTPARDYDGDALMDSAAPPPPPAPAEEVVMSAPGAYADDEMRSEMTSGSVKEAPGSPPPPPPPVAPRSDTATAKKAEAGRSDSGGEGPGAAVVRNPMLIYTADVELLVDDAAASLSRVQALARELGGFLARRDDASITIRVPVARFEEALGTVEGLGEVTHRSVSTEDVTEQYMDLEIRLMNLRAIRGRLQKLLEKAEKVEESILIERELGRVNGEIDRIEGRMKYLRNQAAYSTITVMLHERPRDVVNVKPRLPVYWLDSLGLSRLLQL